MKNQYSQLTLLLCLLLIFTSCKEAHKLAFESKSDGLEIIASEMNRSIHDPQSMSTGDKMKNATGSLQYIIENTYNPNDADLDISQLRDLERGCKLEVKILDERKIDEVINQALAFWLTNAGYDVFYGMKDKEIYVLEVTNKDRLMKHIFTSNGGITSRIETKGTSLKIDGTINNLTTTLQKQESSGPIEISVDQEIEDLLFTFKLKHDQGIKDIIDQLNKEYGISITQKSRPRKVLSIK